VGMNKNLILAALILSLMGCAAALDFENGVEMRPGEAAAESLFNQGFGHPWVGGDSPYSNAWRQVYDPFTYYNYQGKTYRPHYYYSYLYPYSVWYPNYRYYYYSPYTYYYWYPYNLQSDYLWPW
jgi:hypothetical protein